MSATAASGAHARTRAPSSSLRFIGHLTVGEQLRYSALLRMDRKKYSAAERQERVTELLQKVRAARGGPRGTALAARR